MFTITRRLEFDAGHRVLKHESKCKHLHGHRYRCDITVTAPGLDGLGRVIDFGVVKELIGGWIDENWDHNILLNVEDPLLIHNYQTSPIFAGKLPYVMPNGNPTAENIGQILFEVCCRLLPSPITVTNVRVYETPNCYADFSN